MKLQHILFKLLAQSLEKELSELTEQDVLKYYHANRDPDGKLPIQINFGLRGASLECVHADWDADSLLTGFIAWRTINNFDK